MTALERLQRWVDDVGVPLHPQEMQEAVDAVLDIRRPLPDNYESASEEDKFRLRLMTALQRELSMFTGPEELWWATACSITSHMEELDKKRISETPSDRGPYEITVDFNSERESLWEDTSRSMAQPRTVTHFTVRWNGISVLEVIGSRLDIKSPGLDLVKRMVEQANEHAALKARIAQLESFLTNKEREADL